MTVDPITRCDPSDWPDAGAELVQHQRAQTDLRRSTFLSDAGGRTCRGSWLYFADLQAVIAQGEGRKGDGKTARIGARGALQIAGGGPVAGRLALGPGLDEGVEIGAAGHAGRVPPGSGGIVGDGGERAAHALRAHADGVRLVGRWRGETPGHKDTEATAKATRQTEGREAMRMPLTLPFVSSVVLCVLGGRARKTRGG